MSKLFSQEIGSEDGDFLAWLMRGLSVQFAFFRCGPCQHCDDILHHDVVKFWLPLREFRIVPAILEMEDRLINHPRSQTSIAEIEVGGILICDPTALRLILQVAVKIASDVMGILDPMLDGVTEVNVDLAASKINDAIRTIDNRQATRIHARLTRELLLLGYRQTGKTTDDCTSPANEPQDPKEWSRPRPPATWRQLLKASDIPISDTQWRRYRNEEFPKLMRGPHSRSVQLHRDLAMMWKLSLPEFNDDNQPQSANKQP